MEKEIVQNIESASIKDAVITFFRDSFHNYMMIERKAGSPL